MVEHARDVKKKGFWAELLSAEFWVSILQAALRAAACALAVVAVQRLVASKAAA